MKKQLFGFVLMPFDVAFNDVYQLGIKAAITSAGMIAERVDEQTFHQESILTRIYNQIATADFIVADMTGQNPNVFYEVGFAHAKNKPCILLTSKAEDIPFDLKHHRHIIYNDSISILKSKLECDLSRMQKIIDAKSSPINVSLRRQTGDLEKTEYIATGIIELTFDLDNKSDHVSPDIDTVYLYTGVGWAFSQDRQTCASGESDIKPFKLRHILKSPASRLQSKMWSQMRVTGKKTLAVTFKGDAMADEYKLAGSVLVRVVTTAGNFDFPVSLKVVCDIIAF